MRKKIERRAQQRKTRQDEKATPDPPDMQGRPYFRFAPGQHLVPNHGMATGVAGVLFFGAVLQALNPNGEGKFGIIGLIVMAMTVVGTALIAFSPNLGAKFAQWFYVSMGGVFNWLRRRRWGRRVLGVTLKISPFLKTRAGICALQLLFAWGWAAIGVFLLFAIVLFTPVDAYLILCYMALALFIQIGAPILVFAFVLSPVTLTTDAYYQYAHHNHQTPSPILKKWLEDGVHAQARSDWHFALLLAFYAILPMAGVSRTISYISPETNRQSALLRLAAGHILADSDAARGHFWIATFFPIFTGFFVLASAVMFGLVSTRWQLLMGAVVWLVISLVFAYRQCLFWPRKLRLTPELRALLRPPFSPTRQEIRAFEDAVDKYEQDLDSVYKLIVTVLMALIGALALALGKPPGS